MTAPPHACAIKASDLTEALRTEAFGLVYQPQFDTSDYRLTGFEALLRWHHPLRGLVGPGEFIPIAEETGLIVAIGAWVLRLACLEAARWPKPLKLAVNVSAIQCTGPAIVETVRTALRTSGLPADRLELEITETAMLVKDSATLAVMRDLHELGVSLSMDDFGTGYASLGYLRSFPFDRVKIDQSFVRDLPGHNDARAIVRSVLALGRDLGIKVLAEGVETPGQLAFLRQEGCHEAQGYLFSKPVHARAARALASEDEPTPPYPEASTAAQPLIAAPLHVLLVDDVLMHRDVAGSILRAAGHAVVLAESGADAIAWARNADFDVILMDVRMPEMDGLEATRRVRGIAGPRGRVPIVGVTAQAFPEQIAECRLAGMTSHLAKPYTREALLAAVAARGEADASHAPDHGRAAERRFRPDGTARPVAAGTTAEQVLDQAAFARAIAFLQPTAAALHLRIIAERAAALLGLLQAGGADTADIAEAAHMLAGSAGLFGFGYLASVARAFKGAAHFGPCDATRDARKLAAALELSICEIRQRASAMGEA